MPVAKVEQKLHAKIASVLAEVSKIPKRGRNNHQNYNYAMESDVLDSIRPKLAELGIAIYVDIAKPEILLDVSASKSGVAQHMAVVHGKIEFGDGVTGETFSFGIAGQGMDSGDKAVPKAITMAVKYGLLKTFLIPTGDDAEVPAEHEAPVVAAARAVKKAEESGDAIGAKKLRVFKKALEAGVPTPASGETIAAHYGVTVEELGTEAVLDEILAR